jgi:hypothetical protein
VRKQRFDRSTGQLAKQDFDRPKGQLPEIALNRLERGREPLVLASMWAVGGHDGDVRLGR